MNRIRPATIDISDNRVIVYGNRALAGWRVVVEKQPRDR